MMTVKSLPGRTEDHPAQNSSAKSASLVSDFMVMFLSEKCHCLPLRDLGELMCRYNAIKLFELQLSARAIRHLA